MAIWPPAEGIWTQQNNVHRIMDITEHKEEEAPWNKDVHCCFW